MKFIIRELDDDIDQVITPEKNTIVTAIRPHIYRHNFATGSLKLQILNGDLDVIAESENIDIADIGTMDYFHGYVRFYINAYLAADTEYTIRLTGDDGYSFDESAYCAWVNGHDLAKYPITSVPAGHFFYPMDYEMWERTTT